MNDAAETNTAANAPVDTPANGAGAAADAADAATAAAVIATDSAADTAANGAAAAEVGVPDTEAPPAFEPESFIQSLSRRAGVYQMYGAAGELLYVGKAGNLRARVASYFRAGNLAAKTMALVAKIRDIQVTVTDTETDALLLEQNLIKKYRPAYNILFRDDKSYPYIHLSADPFPRLALHRGPKRGGGRYFGPYPGVGAVRESLSFLQKVFKLRQCENSYFRNRSRPCLQHQIGRCSAPCVGAVSEAEYAGQTAHATLFLQGRSRQLMDELADRMEAASRALAYEEAAQLRDQLSQLQQVQAQQAIEGAAGDADIISAVVEAGKACVQVLFARAGRVLGSRSYFPPLKLEAREAEVIAAFLPQFYLDGGDDGAGGADGGRGENGKGAGGADGKSGKGKGGANGARAGRADGARELPRELILSHAPEGIEHLQAALSAAAGCKVELKTRVREARARWLHLAGQTARQNLESHLAARRTSLARFQALQEALGLPALPGRLECFDISHSSGEATVAACVVFDHNGPRKSDYRRFNIEGVAAGDDYGAMRQALQRRYRRLKAGEAALPDILFIDGGKGQVAQAVAALDELQVEGVDVVGVAKGPGRKAGLESLILGANGERLRLNGDHPGLHLIQHIRDEAHRFAIAGHRGRRDKQRRASLLESIPGVGAGRRRELLRHFGGVQGVRRASVDELMKVNGINEKIARAIYDGLRSA